VSEATHTTPPKKTRMPKNPLLTSKAYKFRLYPTKKQMGILEWTLRWCKELYNAALEERREAYRVCGVSYVMQFEDLQITNMTARPAPKQDENGNYLPNGAAQGGLNKSILDAGWGQFIMLCSRKAEEAGGTVVKVSPRNTSQACSGCGCIVPKDLGVRWHACLHCGTPLDRDHNAARNILQRYQDLKGAGSVPQVSLVGGL
jgi:transposase